MKIVQLARLGTGVILLSGLAACGGGGDGGTFVPPPNSQVSPPSGGGNFTAGVYQPSASFAAQCQMPRTGTDPQTARPFVDRPGSVTAENNWLRSWTNELYLWYREVPDINPGSVTTTLAYFDQMKTTAVLASGKSRDRFHFTYDTAEYFALSQSGVSVGYGINWLLVTPTPPRRIVVEFVEPNSRAAVAGVKRGDELQMADGVDAVNDGTTSGVGVLNAATFPQAAGAAHSLTLKSRDTAMNYSVSLTSAAVTSNPVPLTSVILRPSGPVGYVLFNDHNVPSEAALITAINTLRAANVTDLVLDLRYNGGGYLSIASELAYMIAGPRTGSPTFERTQFNDKYPSTNPVTGQALAPIPFYDTSSTNQTLPTLNLSRVFVLTSANTCSASESVINGLRGIDVEVIQIGANTCGKPYGFYPADNCGTTYFSIQLKGVNNKNFGDYLEGFSATRTTGDAQANLPGCPARDDFTRDLGNPLEERLRVALEYRENGRVCTGTGLAQAAVQPGFGPAMTAPARPLWRDNRILN
jgi:carboxyl-terminal processing protease